MSRFEEELQNILENDPLNLLDIKPKTSSVSPDKRLVLSFQKINDFIKKHGREPEKSNNIEERKLYSRLDGIRKDFNKIETLMDYDSFNLLKEAKKKADPKEIKTVDDILENDILGLLDKDGDDIFTLKNIPQTTKEMPSYIARRKPCDDFDKFEHLFKQCHFDLSTGKRKLRPFAKEQQISTGDFFILRGIMVFVAHVGDRERLKNRTNARLRCIFENGTESDMLLRSLSTALYRSDGHRITEHEDKMIPDNQVSSQDNKTGFIYVLKSKSEKKVKIEEREQKIGNIKNLYKIGYSTNPVKERIQNAENEPTYLMGKVSIVSEFECYNMNTQKLESLLHKFFSKSCLDVEIENSEGKRHIPREWFIVPLPVIEEAIHLLMDGTIVKYNFDFKDQTIVKKEERSDEI